MPPNDEQFEYWRRKDIVDKFSWDAFLYLGEQTSLRKYYPSGLSSVKVLDLGCGSGRTTRILRDMGADVIGLDFSSALIQTAKVRDPDTEYLLADATTLPFKSQSFDLVIFSFNGMDCVYPKDSRMQVIRETSRVLSTGGLFIFSHHNLAAMLLGVHRLMRPYKLLWRLKHVLRGSVFKGETYLHDIEESDVLMYYAWPHRVIEDMRRANFELRSIHSNIGILDAVQRITRTSMITKLMDVWPYYVFSKGSF